MRILVVEDERIVAQRLVRLLGRILGKEIESIRDVPTIQEGLVYVRERPIDLLFLDLNLQGQDGFRVLEVAAAGSFQTIIVSAQHDQALRAFEFGVTDFVPKPYNEDRLRQAIERARGRRDAAAPRATVLVVRKSGGIVPIPVEAVVRIKGADDYSELYCTDGSTHLHDKTLASLEKILPDRFERVHRSHIIDVSRVTRYRSEQGSRTFAVMDDAEEIPVSRSWYRRLRDGDTADS